MPLTRHLHWKTRAFNDFLLAQRDLPFAWGVRDCCMFPANAIEAFTGIDIAADFRGKYSDEASAFAAIRSITGGTTIADAAAWCAAKHGLVEWADKNGSPLPRFAQAGDLVVMENGGNLIAGIVHLNGKHLISMAERGPVRLSILTAKRAWHV